MSVVENWLVGRKSSRSLAKIPSQEGCAPGSDSPDLGFQLKFIRPALGAWLGPTPFESNPPVKAGKTTNGNASMFGRHVSFPLDMLGTTAEVCAELKCAEKIKFRWVTQLRAKLLVIPDTGKEDPGKGFSVSASEWLNNVPLQNLLKRRQPKCECVYLVVEGHA